ILTVSIQNETIDNRIAKTLEGIRQNAHRKSEKSRKTDKETDAVERKKGRRNGPTGWKKVIYGVGTIAAAIFIALCVCVANPALAANIPVLENIFARVQDVLRFGRLPEEETTKLYNEKTVDIQSRRNDIKGKTVDTADSKKEENYIYQDQSQGITITFTEYYASNQAIFFGVCIENDEKFPEFATMGGMDYQLIQANTREEYSFRDTEVGGFRNIEGRLEDAHTFVGVMRVDYDSINVDSSKYDAACDEAEKNGEELPEINAENKDYYLDYYEIPDEFEMQMQIECLRGYSPEIIKEEPGSKYTVVNGTKFMLRGNWNYPAVKIKKSDRDVRTIQLDEVNEEGIGVEKIEISPVELTLHIVEPTDRSLYGVVLDKNGEMLITGSSNANELTAAGRDISTVSIYICDYIEYMDEIKGYELEDHEKFRSMLEEKALFKTKVTTTD
ncbi:MAG: DUF4179 domain-containing protein, partial [Lachnospiraceae bacterium]|nr:DUF4179 domain-containing protein [Lachnospiraceae bacterium]